MQYKFKIASTMALILLYSPLSAFAKEVSLYDQPNANSKVVAKVDLAAGVVPIYTPQSGGWIKVGDPRNGNTGWLKSSDLNNANGSSMSFTQQYFSNGNGPHSFQVFQYGRPKPMSDAESKQLLKQMQMHQQAVQQQMQEMEQEMYEMQRGWMGPHMPMMMPVVFVPVQQQSKPEAPKQKPSNQESVKPVIQPTKP